MKSPGMIVLIGVGMLLVGACEKKTETTFSKDSPSQRTSELLPSFENLTHGARLYQEYCALCHGPEAQGHPDWQNPLVTAAPPLNGTGNEWKRRKQDLINAIRNGATRHGEPVMPAWKERLSDQDIEDIIAWFQALWPTDVYDRWRKTNIEAAVSKS